MTCMLHRSATTYPTVAVVFDEYIFCLMKSDPKVNAFCLTFIATVAEARVDDFSFFDCFGISYYLSIEFNCIFFHLRFSNNILCLLLLHFPPKGRWMDYPCRCRFVR